MNIRLLLIAILFAGCSRTFVLPEVPETHPANPRATEAPVATFAIKDKFQSDIKREDSISMTGSQHHMHMNHRMEGEIDFKQQGDRQ